MSSITAVELAAMHPELAADPLLWFVNFAMAKHLRSSDAAHQQLHGLIQVWSSDGSTEFGWCGSYKEARETDPELR